jgi:hypothetical protein
MFSQVHVQEISIFGLMAKSLNALHTFSQQMNKNVRATPNMSEPSHSISFPAQYLQISSNETLHNKFRTVSFTTGSTTGLTNRLV